MIWFTYIKQVHFLLVSLAIILLISGNFKLRLDMNSNFWKNDKSRGTQILHDSCIQEYK